MKKSVSLLLTAVAVSQATTVYLDFGNVAMDPSTGWNSIGVAAQTYNSIVDYTGSIVEGVSVASTAWSIANPSDFSDSDWNANAISDALITNQASQTITISGLSPSTYKVEIVATFRDFSNYATLTNTVAEVNGAYADRNSDGTITDEATLSEWAYTTSDWLVWDGVEVNGNLVVSVKNAGGLTGFTPYGIINAMKITETPEPCTLALLGLGGLVLRGRNHR